MVALTSAYRGVAAGSPEPALRSLAEAGFSHVMWCHQWNTDFLYSTWEMRQLRQWLRAYGLRVVDVHTSVGQEKQFDSLQEYERRAGVELLKNRIVLAARLESDVVVMHFPAGRPSRDDPHWAQALRSLDALLPFARRHGVRIAVENTHRDGVAHLGELLRRYPSGDLGICYDAGHGNLDTRALDDLAALKDRLLAVHLHDNDGAHDQHKLPFMGTVPWERVMRVLATSAYRKCPSMEAGMPHSGFDDERAFLATALETGNRLSAMMAAYRTPGAEGA